MNDAVRIATILCCTFSIGALIALYERLGWRLVPSLPMRLLIASGVVLDFGIALGNYLRLHQPVTVARVPVIAGAVLQALALALLYRWYGTAEGRAHMRKMNG